MSVNMTNTEIIEVFQNEICMLSRQRSSNRRQTLFTVGMNPCIGVILWSDNWVALAHVHDSSLNTFEYSIAAVVKKMRKEPKNSLVYGCLVYSMHYDSRHTDHRPVVSGFLQDAGVILQPDCIGKTKSDDSANVAVSRSGKRLTPDISMGIKYVSPKSLAKTKGATSNKMDRRDVERMPTLAVSVSTDKDKVEVYGHNDFPVDTANYGL